MKLKKNFAQKDNGNNGSISHKKQSKNEVFYTPSMGLFLNT